MIKRDGSWYSDDCFPICRVELCPLRWRRYPFTPFTRPSTPGPHSATPITSLSHHLISAISPSLVILIFLHNHPTPLIGDQQTMPSSILGTYPPRGCSLQPLWDQGRIPVNLLIPNVDPLPILVLFLPATPERGSGQPLQMGPPPQLAGLVLCHRERLQQNRVLRLRSRLCSLLAVV